MPLCAGVALDPLRQLPVQAIQALNLGRRQEKGPAQGSDLTLDTPLLPTRPGRAELRTDQVMRAHLLETGIDRPVARTLLTAVVMLS